MYVGLKMLKSFHTVTPKTSLTQAQKLLEQEHLWMLLVMDGDKLVGYLRSEDISAALPSVLTTLEKHEALYLLTKLTVDKIMRRDITAVAPELEIEAAADIMCRKNLAGLAVVDAAGSLVGYINRTVMLEVLVEEMGFTQGGSRLVISVEDRRGVIHELSGIILDQDVSIISTGTFYHDGRRMVVMRLATDDASKIAAAIQERGYRLMTAADFVGEWIRQ
jgi:acetoin utilization protein AcuB